MYSSLVSVKRESTCEGRPRDLGNYVHLARKNLEFTINVRIWKLRDFVHFKFQQTSATSY